MSFFSVIALCGFLLFFPLNCEAKSPVKQYKALLGTWVSKPPGKKLKFYWDNTLFLRIGQNVYYRGLFVLQGGTSPIFFLLINNQRVKCPLGQLGDKSMSILGETPLAGTWVKKDNKYRAYW